MKKCSGVTVKDNLIHITKPGVYYLEGTLYDGSVIIEAGSEDVIQLVLDGVSISSANYAPIYAKSADKVFITLADGTDNYLNNNGEFEQIDLNNVDSVIFSKCDLTLNGSGTLAISTGNGHGVVGKDEVVIGGGNYTLDVSSHGICANDSLAIAEGNFGISCEKRRFSRGEE